MTNSDFFTRTGLTESDRAQLLGALAKFPHIQKAAIFGSRARGTYRAGSDIDIALWLAEGAASVATALRAKLEDETTLPYFFDVVEYDRLKDESLKKDIDAHHVQIV